MIKTLRGKLNARRQAPFLIWLSFGEVTFEAKKEETKKHGSLEGLFIYLNCIVLLPVEV